MVSYRNSPILQFFACTSLVLLCITSYYPVIANRKVKENRGPWGNSKVSSLSVSSNPTADKKEKGGWILLIVPKESPLPPTSHTLRARPVSSLCEPHLGLGSIFHFTCLFPHSLCLYILQNPAQNHNFQLFHRYSQLERSFSSSHPVLWSVLTNVSLTWSFMLLTPLISLLGCADSGSRDQTSVSCTL